jgi:hypothetical protein
MGLRLLGRRRVLLPDLRKASAEHARAGGCVPPPTKHARAAKARTERKAQPTGRFS